MEHELFEEKHNDVSYHCKKMLFQKADIDEFMFIKDFYWNLIDLMSDQSDKIGWKKGIYPTDSFLKESLSKGELFTLKKDNQLYGCVILNSKCNEGYANIPWSIDCHQDDVLIPHVLAVSPKFQGMGIGKQLVEEILKYARSIYKKTVRLDILGINDIAEKLYTKCGFHFVQAKTMFYEDTGWTEYKMFELNL